MKRIMTIDDLYRYFCDKNESVKFDAADNDTGPIVVDIPAAFEFDKESLRGMMTTKIKVCHTLLNRNNVYISEDNMKAAMGTLKYRPILAYIHQLPNGEYDFFTHNYEVVMDEDGSEEMLYLESQVGCMTADEPYLEYDKDHDKTYVVGFGVIPEEYTKAADIIRRKDGTKVSCELVIESCSYNAKQKYLELGDFYFGGVTLLGVNENGIEIREGMEGSRLDIQDFCHSDIDRKIDDVLQNALNRFSERFEDMMIKKGGCSMEETIVTTETPVVEEPEVIEEPVAEEVEDEIEAEATEKPTRYSINEESGNMVITYEISHEDTVCALFELLYERYGNDFWYIASVYDTRCVFKMDGKYYQCKYSKDGDNVALVGDSEQVFAEFLTQAEVDSLAEMRQNYEAYKSFKEEYEAAEKATIFERVEYSEIKDQEKFVELRQQYEKYSMDELEAKCNAMLVEHIKASMFDATQDKPRAVSRKLESGKSKKAQAYSGLFDE